MQERFFFCDRSDDPNGALLPHHLTFHPALSPWRRKKGWWSSAPPIELSCCVSFRFPLIFPRAPLSLHRSSWIVAAANCMHSRVMSSRDRGSSGTIWPKSHGNLAHHLIFLDNWKSSGFIYQEEISPHILTRSRSQHYYWTRLRKN